MATPRSEYPPEVVQRPKHLPPTPHRPNVARRYPRLYRGDMAAAALLRDVLQRRGTSQIELAEDLDISPRIVHAWCTGERAVPLGVLLCLQNGRLAEALLYALLETRRANDNDNKGHR